MSEHPVIEVPDGAPARLQPPVSPAGEPFWKGTRRRALVLQWCTACEVPIHYPREACPRCLGTSFDHREAAGSGVVHALSTMPKPANPTMAGRAPYVVALVDLAEGVRMLTNLVGDGADGAAVGDAVALAWEPLDDGRHLPVFVVAAPT